MDSTKYDKIAERKDHSDVLYYQILSTCLVANSALGVGAATILNNIKSVREIIIAIALAVAGIIINFNFNRYLQNEKNYQSYLIDFYDAVINEFVEFPDIFYRDSAKTSIKLFGSKWSRNTYWFSAFWFGVLTYSIGFYFGAFQHG